MIKIDGLEDIEVNLDKVDYINEIILSFYDAERYGCDKYISIQIFGSEINDVIKLFTSSLNDLKILRRKMIEKGIIK